MTNLSKTSRTNLRILADYLRGPLVPPPKFSMSAFAVLDDARIIIAKLTVDEHLALHPATRYKDAIHVTGEVTYPYDWAYLAHTCGTSACALGYAPLAGIEPLPSETWWTYSNRVFELSSESETWEFMFSGDWTDENDTPRAAAARIMYVLDGHFISGTTMSRVREVQLLNTHYDEINNPYPWLEMYP